jgi:hypothetical protein
LTREGVRPDEVESNVGGIAAAARLAQALDRDDVGSLGFSSILP